MKQGLSDDQGIPGTFRDAIRLTNLLGIPYLWIDSLCIIQGDDADWRAEAQKMVQVYQNAYLTIAAASSDDDRKRCLHQRPFSYGQLRVISQAGKSTTIYFRDNEHVKRIWGVPRKQPLEFRAWVLQEQVLSRRTIRYCSYHAEWICQKGVECEINTWRHAMQHQQMRSTPSKSQWRRYVPNFHGRQLTYETDKFPAMAGLVVQESRDHDGVYLAELWSDELPQDFVFEWRGARRPPSYLAPSWSWAALNGAVSFPHDPQELSFRDLQDPGHHVYRLPTFAITHSDIKTHLESSFGQILEGSSLTIQGHLIPLEANAAGLTPEETPAFRLVTHGQPVGKLSCRLDLPQPVSDDVLALVVAFGLRRRFRIHVQETSMIPHCTRLHVLLVSKSRRHGDGYERVGWFELSGLARGVGAEILRECPVQSVILY